MHLKYFLPVCLMCCALAGVAVGAGAPIVIMLSWDGMRHDYPDRGSFPALERMMRDGLRAERLVPVYPSNTFPGHVSIATGTWPDTHGIVDNHFLDRDRGQYRYESDANWLLAEPLWIAAERQGVPVATYFWVGSESDWRGQGTTYRMAPFDGERPESEKVDKILSWLDLPEGERPRLIMSYWAGADSTAHRYGPEAREVAEQIADQDAQLERLITGIDKRDLWARTTLIIVSDHGMTETGGYIDVRAALEDAGIDARVVGSTLAHVFVEDLRRRERVRDVLAGIDGVTVLDEAFLKRHGLAIPERNGDIVIAAQPPDRFSRPGGAAGAYLRARLAMGASIGGHGYRPELEDMGGIFLAYARGVKRGARIGAVRQVDVAATVAKLLAIEPPLASEGIPITLNGER